MKSIKTILFGIALMVFGFGSCYIGALTNWTPAQIIGIFVPVVGVGFAVAGYFGGQD